MAIKYLIGLFSLIITFILIIDWGSLTHFKNQYQLLQRIQQEKEKMLTQRLNNKKITSESITESATIYKLSALCESTSIGIKKMLLKKPSKKPPDHFEISLELLGNYANFLTLISKLSEIPWGIDIPTFQISKENDSFYPLKVKLSVMVSNHNALEIPPHKPFHLSNISPFLIRRHAGNMIINDEKTELIQTGEIQNSLLIQTPMIN